MVGVKLHWDSHTLIGPLAVFEDGRWVLVTPAFNEGPHPSKQQDYLFVEIEPMPSMTARIANDIDAFGLGDTNEGNQP